MSRRLPVYILLDTSGSMSGEPIQAVESGMQMLVSELRRDPQALETAYLSVITFDSSANQIVPLTELTAFQMPSLKANGTTALGEALSLLAKKINSEVTKTTMEQKGDWKPLIFIFTDGQPTDSWQNGLADLKKCKTGIIVACAAGTGADTSVLQQITEVVVKLDTASADDIKQFFKWASASVSASSAKIDSGGGEPSGIDSLPPPPPVITIL